MKLEVYDDGDRWLLLACREGRRDEVLATFDNETDARDALADAEESRRAFLRGEN